MKTSEAERPRWHPLIQMCAMSMLWPVDSDAWDFRAVAGDDSSWVVLYPLHHAKPQSAARHKIWCREL